MQKKEKEKKNNNNSTHIHTEKLEIQAQNVTFKYYKSPKERKTATPKNQKEENH